MPLVPAGCVCRGGEAHDKRYAQYTKDRKKWVEQNPSQEAPKQVQSTGDGGKK